MNTATSTPDMKPRANRNAFTLIELLVVIAIIAIIAGLVVGLAGVGGKEKKLKRTRTELAKLVTLIEVYKTKVGMYPPDNPDPKDSFTNPPPNSLLYELAGAIRDRSNVADPLYKTPFGNITSNEIWSTYGGPDVFPEEAAELGMENDADLARDAGDGLPACLGVEGVALAFHRGNAAVPQVAEVAKRHAGCDDSAVRAATCQQDRAGGQYYQATWDGALASSPSWAVIVSTFNEWMESTQIEPAVQYGDQYLGLTKQNADAFHNAF